MKNLKLLTAAGILVIALIVFISGYFLGRKNLSGNNLGGNSRQESSASVQTTENGAKQEEEQKPQTKIITDEFTIDLPAGWKQTPAAIGALAMGINASEDVIDPAARRINFKSYYAVSFDTLQGKTLGEYLQTVKDELRLVASNPLFSNEGEITINGRSARAIEAEVFQQGTDFKVLIIAVAGEKEDVWVITFNTTKSGWKENKEIFSTIANSFILKK